MTKIVKKTAVKKTKKSKAATEKKATTSRFLKADQRSTAQTAALQTLTVALSGQTPKEKNRLNAKFRTVLKYMTDAQCKTFINKIIQCGENQTKWLAVIDETIKAATPERKTVARERKPKMTAMERLRMIKNKLK